MNYDKHIWEGWTVRDFVHSLTIQFDRMVSNEAEFGTKAFNTNKSIRDWCKSNQPYYKKHIPEVANHYINQYNMIQENKII